MHAFKGRNRARSVRTRHVPPLTVRSQRMNNATITQRSQRNSNLVIVTVFHFPLSCIVNLVSWVSTAGAITRTSGRCHE